MGDVPIHQKCRCKRWEEMHSKGLLGHLFSFFTLRQKGAFIVTSLLLIWTISNVSRHGPWAILEFMIGLCFYNFVGNLWEWFHHEQAYDHACECGGPSISGHQTISPQTHHQ